MAIFGGQFSWPFGMGVGTNGSYLDYFGIVTIDWNLSSSRAH